MSNPMELMCDCFSYWYIAGLAVTGYLSYYYLEVVQPPILACGKGKYREFLESNLPILREKYWPTLWCWESRLQTVLGHYIRELVVPAQPYRREIIKFSDGGEAALDWREENIEPDAPILIALPGLTGSSAVEYMKNIAHTMNSVGIRCVVFNNRGLGGLQLLTSRAYCAAYVEDISDVVKHVRAKHPQAPIAVLGVSMGGLIVGNYISTKAVEARSLLAAAVLISPPWNVFVGTESIEKPVINSMLNRQLANNLVDTFSRNRKLWEGALDCNAVTGSRTVREFDTNFTSKAFGYRDLKDYYNNASIHDKIEQFSVPTLCLSAADDPFQPIYGIPVNAANKSQHVAIVIPSRGGHIGFMEGLLPVSLNQYMQRLVAQYLSSMLFSENYTKFQPACPDASVCS